jgi:hypothetical protein
MAVRGRPALGAAKKSVTISGRVTAQEAELIRREFGSDTNAIREALRIAQARAAARSTK